MWQFSSIQLLKSRFAYSEYCCRGRSDVFNILSRREMICETFTLTVPSKNDYSVNNMRRN